jgi:hypothetical protein
VNRVWHHFSLWEEGPAGLWRVNPDIFNLDAALNLMRDTPRWVSAMSRVTVEWRYSSEQNLSHTEHNRIAWIGQAAVCLAIGQPSVVTRKAWWHLTDMQQDEANAGAKAAIIDLEETRCPDRQLALTFSPQPNNESPSPSTTSRKSA